MVHWRLVARSGLAHPWLALAAAWALYKSRGRPRVPDAGYGMVPGSAPLSEGSDVSEEPRGLHRDLQPGVYRSLYVGLRPNGEAMISAYASRRPGGPMHTYRDLSLIMNPSETYPTLDDVVNAVADALVALCARVP